MSIKSNRIVAIAVILAALGIASYAFVSLAILQIKVAFAVSHIEIFHMMSEQAVKADAVDAANKLEYVVNHYPSGTIQSSGTKIDLLVESVRRHSASRIIEHLRRITGRDLGDDPMAWISAYAASDGVARQ